MIYISGLGLYLASLLVRYFPKATVYGLGSTLLLVLVPGRTGQLGTGQRILENICTMLKK